MGAFLEDLVGRVLIAILDNLGPIFVGLVLLVGVLGWSSEFRGWMTRRRQSGRQSSNSEVQNSLSDVSSSTLATSPWCRAHSDALHVTQIIAVLPPETAVPARVSNLVPGGAPGIAFLRATWAATAVLLDGTPEQAGPFVFAKATNVVEALKGQPVSIAFAYYRMDEGGLFQLFVEVDTPFVRSRINDRYLCERLFNVDDNEDLDLIRQLCSREFLEVCFVAPGAQGPCTGYFGLRIGIPVSVRDALAKELDSLISYNRSLPSRNSQAAIAQYNRENPMDSTPVLSMELATEQFGQEETVTPQPVPTRSTADNTSMETIDEKYRDLAAGVASWWREDAEEWWASSGRTEAYCDDEGERIAQGDGYTTGRRLLCQKCATDRLAKSVRWEQAVRDMNRWLGPGVPGYLLRQAEKLWDAPKASRAAGFTMRIGSVFDSGGGVMVAGTPEGVPPSVGDTVHVVGADGTREATIKDTTSMGGRVAYLLAGIAEGSVKQGDMLEGRTGTAAEPDATSKGSTDEVESTDDCRVNVTKVSNSMAFLEIQAQSLDKCRQLARDHVPTGFRIASESVVSDGKATEHFGAGETTDQALLAAKAQLPQGAKIIEEKVLAKATRFAKTVEADSEAEARTTLHMDIGTEAQLEDITLVQAGKKGFLRIGKRKALWAGSVVNPAKASVIGIRPAVVRFTLKGNEKVYFTSPNGRSSVVALVEVLFVGIGLPDDMVDFIPTVIDIDDVVPRFKEMGEYKLTKANSADAAIAASLISGEAMRRQLNVLVTPVLDYDPQLSIRLLGRRLQFMLGIMTTVAKGQKPQIAVAPTQRGIEAVLALR